MNVPKSVKIAFRSLRVNMDISTLVLLVLFPLMFLYVMGVMYETLIPQGIVWEGQNITYSFFLVPGILAQGLIWSATQAGSSLWLDKRFGMFEQILCGPFSRLDYIVGTTLSMLIAGLGSALFILILGIPFILGVSITAQGVLLIIVTLSLGSLLLGALMLAISARVKSSQAFSAISIIIVFPLMFASSALYPLTDKTPPVLRYVAMANPITYIADLLRAGIMGTFGLVHLFELIALTIESLVVLFFAMRVYYTVQLD